MISSDGQVWDVKRNKPRQISAGEKQVSQYVTGTWRDHFGVPLDVGGPEIEARYFYYKSGYTTYKVQYEYAGNGVITYDYVPSEFDTKALLADAISVGVSVGLGYLGGALFNALGGIGAGAGAGGLSPVFP